MPSPTSKTRPTSRTSILASNCSISACSTDAISSALNFMDAPVDQLFAKTTEVGLQRAVEDDVADLHDQTSDEVGDDFGLEDRFSSEDGSHTGDDGVLLRVG